MNPSSTAIAEEITNRIFDEFHFGDDDTLKATVEKVAPLIDSRVGPLVEALERLLPKWTDDNWEWVAEHPSEIWMGGHTFAEALAIRAALATVSPKDSRLRTIEEFAGRPPGDFAKFIEEESGAQISTKGGDAECATQDSRADAATDTQILTALSTELASSEGAGNVQPAPSADEGTPETDDRECFTLQAKLSKIKQIMEKPWLDGRRDEIYAVLTTPPSPSAGTEEPFKPNETMWFEFGRYLNGEWHELVSSKDRRDVEIAIERHSKHDERELCLVERTSAFRRIHPQQP